MRVRPSLLLLATALAAFLAAQTAFGFTGAPEGGGPSPQLRPAAAVVQPAAEALAQAASAPARPRGHLLAALRGDVSYSLSAGGPAAGTLKAFTEFGSAQVLSVVGRRGPWLAVVTSALDNNRLAWVRKDQVKLRRTRWSLRADLSQHTVTLYRYGRAVRRIGVAIGRPGSETPTGRFAVTDKLAGTNYGAYYGCCILALSGHQPNTPPGWTGGNRIAIHGTDSPGSIGTAASAGCLRAGDSDLRALMQRLPVGTPVSISA
jgi:lipoprotein-anchoring transpeptidase ErfK/SrfK